MWMNNKTFAMEFSIMFAKFKKVSHIKKANNNIANHSKTTNRSNKNSLNNKNNNSNTIDEKIN